MLSGGSTDEKRLLKFLQPEKSPKKRLAYALDYVRNSNRQNENRFMNEQYLPLFDIIANTLKQYDEEEEVSDQHKIFGMLRNTAMKKIMTPKSQEEKFLGIIELLDRIVFHLPHHCSKKAYTDTLKEILMTLLHPEHSVTYRLPVIEILLRIIQQQVELAEPADQFITLLLASIPFNIRPQTPLSQYINRGAVVPPPPHLNIPPIAILLPVERERDGRDPSYSPDLLIAKYLEVLFRVSVHGLNHYEGTTITRSFMDRPMDEVNNFVFWRDFIFSHLSPYMIGTKALEAYLANVTSMDGDKFPVPGSTAPHLPSPRSLRFVAVPHSIQCVIEIWFLEILSSRYLVDHLFSLDSVAHVFLLMEQRFQSELVRNKLGIDLARRTLDLFTVLLSDTDLLPKTKAVDHNLPSLQSYTYTNTIETLSSHSLPLCFLLSRRPLFLTQYWDLSLARIVVIVLQCFNRIDEGESTTTLQTNQSRLIRDCLSVIRLVLKICQSAHVAQRIRERLYDICKLYLPRSRFGVVGSTLTEVIEVTVGSHFLAIDWKDPHLHTEFSMKFHEWLIDKTVTRDHDLSIAAGGIYGSYSKPGDHEAPPPSEFKIFLISLWGTLLFTAFDVCWIYLDYYRDVNLSLSPEYLTNQISPKEILELTKFKSESSQTPSPQTHDGIIQPASHNQAHGATFNLWTFLPEDRLTLLSINSLYDAILCIDRLLALLPLRTISILSPQLHTIAIGAVCDILQYALKHVIVKENHFQPPLPLPVDKLERSKQKLVNKARAKLEEYERGSSNCAISPDTILSLIFPFLLVAALDTRILFENSRLNALEAICTAIQTRTLCRMSSTLQEQCLGIIYQALVQTGNLKFPAVVVTSCSSFFSLAIPGSSLLVEPFFAATNKLFQAIQWKGLEVYRGTLTRAANPFVTSKFSSDLLKELFQLDHQSLMPSTLVDSCIEILSGVVSYCHRYPDITSLSTKRNLDSRSLNERAHSMELTLLLTLEGNKIKDLIPRIVEMIDKYICAAKEYSVKNQMIHLLTFALVLQINSHERNTTQDQIQSQQDPPRSPRDDHSPSPNSTQKIDSTEKMIVNRFTSYLADGDKPFVLGVINALLNLNDLYSKSHMETCGNKIIESLSTVVRINMIELIQLVIERYRYQAVDLVRSRSSPVTPLGVDRDSERDRVKSFDDIQERTAERKKVSIPSGPSGASSPVPQAPFVSTHVEEDPNRFKPLVDVIKAGLNCLTRWALHHPSLIESMHTKELFLECFDVCSVHPIVFNLINSPSLPSAPNRDDIPPPNAGTSVDNTFEAIPIGNTTGVSHSHHLSSFSFAMNYLAEEEKLLEHIHSDQLPKILHKTDGSFSLSDILAVLFHNQDAELKEIGKLADTHMRHILKYFRNLPPSVNGLSQIDSKLATDFVGLCRMDLRKYMGTVYASLGDSLFTSDSLGITDNARETLLPPHGSNTPITINEDGLDCLSNDEVEKQYPIHIAYRSSHVLTIVEGEDGVARLITRDMIGAHVWTAIPIEVLPLKPSTEAIEKFHVQRQDRAAFVSNLTSTEGSLLQNSHFAQENPLRKKSSEGFLNALPETHSSDDSSRRITSLSKRSSTHLIKKRSVPVFSSNDSKNNPLVSSKKSHRVAALLETLQTDSNDNEENNSTATATSHLPTILPAFSRSFSENDAVHLAEEVDPNTAWPHVTYNLKKDTLREFLDELPLEDVEDSTLLGGVRTLKEVSNHDLDRVSIDKISSPLHTLAIDSTIESAQSKYSQMHNWIYRMLSDGFLWTHFIEFLRKEYSEESGCFLRDVYELHLMLAHERSLSSSSSSPSQPSPPPSDSPSPYNKITIPEWKKYSHDQLLETINKTSETIHQLYLTKGSQFEVNVADSTFKDVTNRFTSSFYNSPTQGEEAMKSNSSLTPRDLSFYEKVFVPAFHDVATMLVRDKLTRFLMQSNSTSTILNDIETINGEIDKAHRMIQLSLESSAPIPSCLPPPPPETVTLRDPSRLLASHLGLFPSILYPIKKQIDVTTSPLSSISSSPLLRLFQTYSSLEDYTILCGSNVSQSTLHLCQTAPSKTSRQILQELRHLDDLSSREQFKFAVLYVAQGQYTQKAILANSGGSALYEKFLQSLGEDIDLATHRGFNGRLDSKRFSNGRIFPYFADDHVEVFFHVATRMPTSQDDDQQIGKKRHIGNDYIHIVWTEDSREYSPLTITSDFGDVVITIRPLNTPPPTPTSTSTPTPTIDNFQSCYCVIRIYVKDSTVRCIGPLLDGMIVPFPLVSSLVRLTAIQANRAVNQLYRKVYDPPYIHRSNTISDLIASCGVPFSYDLLLNLLFQQATPHLNLQNSE